MSSTRSPGWTRSRSRATGVAVALVRRHFGIASFGVTRGRPERRRPDHQRARRVGAGRQGGAVPRPAGHAVFELEGERVVAPAGTFVFVRPGVKRTAFAEEPGTTILAFGGTPGKKYEPHGWELWAPVGAALQGGRIRRGGGPARELVEEHPQYADLSTTSRAVRASPAGRRTRSSTYDTRSTAPTSRAYAEDDSDFDAIRHEPAFEELSTGSTPAGRALADLSLSRREQV